MRCRQCNYPLWNLTARACPECGAPFLPGDFDFAPSTVKYCCPSCDQDYYGTSERGHLVPPQFDCIRCGRSLHMNEMVLRPLEGVAEHATAGSTIPWLQREHLGRWKAWWRTIGHALVRPGRMMDALPATASGQSALWYLLLVTTVTTLAAVLPMLLFMGVMVFSVGGGGGGGPASLPFIGGTTVFMLASIVGQIILTFLWCAMAHVCLRMGGETAGGIGRTWQTLCYTSGASIFTAVPCFGPYFGWIWWVVSATLGMMRSQRVSGLRASAATITPPVIMLLVLVGAYVALISFSVRAATNARTIAMQSMATAQAQAQASELTEAISAVVSEKGSLPAHGGELLATGVIEPGFFVVSSAPGSGIDGKGRFDSIFIGEKSLDDLMGTTLLDRKLVAEAAGAALPANVVQHRVGDWVFCWHGHDEVMRAKPELASSLWVAVAYPEYASADTFDPDEPEEPVVAITKTGAQFTLQPGLFKIALEAQNEVRAVAGLAPLCAPWSVTAEVPQVGPP